MSVAIVGAGPGDPGLITVRALELVEQCEVLVYDRLVSSQLVARATGATRIARETLTQIEVNELLVHHGRRGRAVVRLKGGDPFVFGRGGEEVEALVDAGVSHEIVPGVSTLTAVPALAGIPLTHRGIAAQVTVLTGTTGDGSDLDYARLASTPGTLVIFMGLKRLASIADNLILNGRAVDEPVAVVSQLSLPNARVVVGTLATIAATAADLTSPAVVIVGGVASLAWQVRQLAEEVGQRS
ncbi:MAG TPA: uroporphyrinogen-III C-methyltransferase [Gaiellaceae bacterium]